MNGFPCWEVSEIKGNRAVSSLFSLCGRPLLEFTKTVRACGLIWEVCGSDPLVTHWKKGYMSLSSGVGMGRVESWWSALLPCLNPSFRQGLAGERGKGRWCQETKWQQTLKLMKKCFTKNPLMVKEGALVVEGRGWSRKVGGRWSRRKGLKQWERLSPELGLGNGN